jgi:hypothetical protein
MQDFISKEAETVPDDRVVQECERHGLGYMTFEDPADYGRFDIVNTARVRDPDPYEVDSFILS